MTVQEASILLVEDSEDDAELAVLALESVGVTRSIEVARDGEEALEFLFGGAAGVEARRLVVVLLDVNLPKVDGFEVLRRIRAEERTRWLPTVMLSSSDERRDIERAYELGVNSYVRKPVEFSQYSQALRQLGQYWIHTNRAAVEVG